jgi:hypothetical protein
MYLLFKLCHTPAKELDFGFKFEYLTNALKADANICQFGNAL